MITILANNHRQHNFDHLIEKTTNELFRLMKLTTNGLDAVFSLTQGNTSGCLVACGSYVLGDSGPLQSWSTSAFKIGSGPASIIGPEEPKISSFTLQHTITLPYSIEGAMSYNNLCQYEDECLEHLHILCLYNKVMKTKVTCILMEISLASNGSTLSDHALTLLGELAHLHDFSIVVDEIMTGGRTLPYSIEGAMSYDNLCQYKDECLEHLHILCLYNKVMKNKVTCILMEISLASNGSTLSDCALIILGELARLHDFSIVVDAIMTGGRTKKML